MKMIKGFWLALSIFSNIKKMIITQQEPFLDWELHEAVALSISWNFWLHYLILVVPAFFCWLCLFLHGGLFLLVAGLAMSLGPRRRRTEEEREKNTQTLKLSTTLFVRICLFCVFRIYLREKWFMYMGSEVHILGKSSNTETTSYSPSWVPNRSL